jgi:hypothetical protein
MRSLRAAVFVCAVAVSPLAAQTRVDLSGKWSIDPTSDQAALPAGSTMDVTIKQDEKTVTIDIALDTPNGGQKRSTVVKLDGSPTDNFLTSQGGTVPAMSTATWEGRALRVMTTVGGRGAVVVQTDKWLLDAEGKTLVLETTVSTGGQQQKSKLTFIKS